MQIDTIPISFRNVLENGKFKLNDDHGNMISEGVFKEALRDGKWIYHPTDTTTIFIDWATYLNDKSKIEINYPENWKIIESAGRPFQAIFPSKGAVEEKGKYFIILSHDKDSIDMDLDGYQRHYKSQMFSTENVLEYVHFMFETASGKKFYFLRYIIKRQDEVFSIFTFIGNKGSKIFDLTYSTTNANDEERHITFFDMVTSLQLNGEWFFSPYDPVVNYARFEYQDQPKKTS